ncbi:hypothetical protein SFRURICE_015793 [Spodoptera frugiperda]|nr:hypothetical protein SFRURICE_015793 [Spodoptera frugiperda]
MAILIFFFTFFDIKGCMRRRNKKRRQTKTKKAMSKDEVSLLVDLIQSHPIIITKETNAATNKLKEESWM